MNPPPKSINGTVLIRGGLVVDGDGRTPYPADVLVNRGRIERIGRLPAFSNAHQLDATGCLITPGFIDIHSHSDFTLFVDPRAISSITQGVTLEVVGNCGHGCAPISDVALARSNIYGCQSHHEIPWRSMAGYLEALEARAPAVNVATLVPNGNLRLAVMGIADRAASRPEIIAMGRRLAEGLEAGAFGLSTGLEYGPEAACSEEEVTGLCEIAARYEGAFYATHTRNRNGEAAEAISEPLRICAAAGLPLQISHIAVVARLADDSRWAVEQALAQVDEARHRGMDVGFDMHTRPFGTTNLSAVLPSWALAGDKSDVAARLHDPHVRERLRGHRSIVTALARRGWDRIVLRECRTSPELSGKSIADISHARGVDPYDAIYDILLDELDDMHSLMILGYAYRPEDLSMAFDHPQCMVGSDATALATDGPLAEMTFHGAYTWAAWYFRYFVQVAKRLTLQEAVRRMTSLPADRLGLKDRGRVQAGRWADIAIFNPNTFGERGTVDHPNQTAEGMVHVLVNGCVTVQDGEVTGMRGGQVLRR